MSFNLALDLSVTIVIGVSQDAHTEVPGDALSGKCLSCKHKDLRSDPQNAHIKKADVVANPQYLSTEEAEREDPGAHCPRSGREPDGILRNNCQG